jgi:hypothetical protein
MIDVVFVTTRKSSNITSYIDVDDLSGEFISCEICPESFYYGIWIATSYI